MREEWARISEYPNYEVSTIGRVRLNSSLSQRMLTQSINDRGYCYVNLRNSDGRKCKKVHRLVLSAFSGVDYINHLDLNHKNEIKTDNRIENLEWCSHSYNMKFGTLERLSASKRVYRYVQYDMNGNYIQFFESKRSLKEAGFQDGNILRLTKGLDGRSQHKGYKWKVELIK